MCVRLACTVAHVRDEQDTGVSGARWLGVTVAEPIRTLRRVRTGGLARGWTGLLPVGMGGQGGKGMAPLFGLYAGPAASTSRGAANDVPHGTVAVGDEVRVVEYRADGRLVWYGRVMDFISAFLGCGRAVA